MIYHWSSFNVFLVIIKDKSYTRYEAPWRGDIHKHKINGQQDNLELKQSFMCIAQITVLFGIRTHSSQRDVCDDSVAYLKNCRFYWFERHAQVKYRLTIILQTRLMEKMQIKSRAQVGRLISICLFKPNTSLGQ